MAAFEGMPKMGIWATILLLIQGAEKGWLESQITFGNLVTFISLLVGGAYGYSKMQAKQERHSEQIKELRNDLDEHCKDKSVHILSYEELIRRLDRIEGKVDARNITSGRLPRNS